jgi:hypothetical protein
VRAFPTRVCRAGTTQRHRAWISTSSRRSAPRASRRRRRPPSITAKGCPPTGLLVWLSVCRGPELARRRPHYRLPLAGPSRSPARPARRPVPLTGPSRRTGSRRCRYHWSARPKSRSWRARPCVNEHLCPAVGRTTYPVGRRPVGRRPVGRRTVGRRPVGCRRLGGSAGGATVQGPRPNKLGPWKTPRSEKSSWRGVQ